MEEAGLVTEEEDHRVAEDPRSLHHSGLCSHREVADPFHHEVDLEDPGSHEEVLCFLWEVLDNRQTAEDDLLSDDSLGDLGAEDGLPCPGEAEWGAG